MFPPDTFWYFILLLGINIVCATQLLFSYNRTPLILFNVLVFVLLAGRCCTEYYLPQVDDFQMASNIAAAHSLFTIWLNVIIHACTWWYIRPFRAHRYERRINWGMTCLLVVSRLVFTPYLLDRSIWKFAPKKIDGYWQFYTDYNEPVAYLYSVVTIIAAVIIAWVLLKDLLRDKRIRLDKWVLFIIYIMLTILITYDALIAVDDGVQYRIPNTAFLHMFYPIMANRFFTNYRFFQDTSMDVIGDSFNAISDLAIFTKSDKIIRQANAPARGAFYIKDNATTLLELLVNNSAMLRTEAEVLINSLLLNLNESKEIKLSVDGDERYFLISASEYYKKKQLFGYTFFLQDITEKRRNKRLIQAQHEELLAMNDTKDRIFTILGQDLRPPAIAFQGLGAKINELLQAEDYKKLNILGESVEREAFKLNKLTDNLLNWALIQKDLSPYEPRTIPMRQVIEEVLLDFEKTARNKRIELSYEVATKVQVSADYSNLLLMLRNLVDNAIKYTKIGGRVAIFAIQEENFVRIQVTDTGIGIPQQDLSSIFDLRQDIDRLATGGKQGTGLGLYLVKALAIRNQGKVDVDSELGKGTSFGIVLPAVKMRVEL